MLNTLPLLSDVNTPSAGTLHFDLQWWAVLLILLLVIAVAVWAMNRQTPYSGEEIETHEHGEHHPE